MNNNRRYDENYVKEFYNFTISARVKILTASNFNNDPSYIVTLFFFFRITQSD